MADQGACSSPDLVSSSSQTKLGNLTETQNAIIAYPITLYYVLPT